VSFADANRASIKVIEESAWGITPATGKSREVRLTSSSLSASKETATSDEIRSDRMVSGLAEVGAASGGDIGFEFSAGAQDDFLAAFMMGAWSRPMSRDFWAGQTIAVTGSSEITMSGTDISAYITAGHRILLKGFVNPANAGYFSVASVAFSSGDTVITVNESTLSAEAGLEAGRLYDANDVVVLNDTSIESTSTGFTGTGNVFQSAIAAGQLEIGQKIVVDGLAGVTGVYTITSLENNVLTTSPAPNAVVAAGDAVSVKGSMLRNPADPSEITQRMFTLETAYADIGQYMKQDGMVPGTFSIELSTGSIVTGSIGFQGRETVMAQAPVIGAVPYDQLDTVSGEVANATTNVGAIIKDGATFGSAIQSLSLSGEANLRTQNGIGSKFAKGIGAGRFNLTGSMSVYFEDETLFNDFLNHATVSLSFAITDLDGQSYVFTVPAVKFSQDSIAPGGIDQDVMEGVEFTAIRDAATDCMLQIDRFSPNA
jgi:hypothetical protein